MHTKRQRAVELVVRAAILACTMAAAILMGTNKQTSYLFGATINAKFNYSPAFIFFVWANVAAGVYSFISLLGCCRGYTKDFDSSAKRVVVFTDVVVTVVVAGAVGAASAIAYVGREGNDHAGWMAICPQFHRFCNRVAASIIASIAGGILLLFLSLLSAFSF